MTPTYWPTKKEKPFVIAQLRVTLLKEEIHRDVFSIIELEIALDNKVSRLAVNHSNTPNRIFLTIIRSYKSMCAALTPIIMSQIAILKFKKYSVHIDTTKWGRSRIHARYTCTSFWTGQWDRTPLHRLTVSFNYLTMLDVGRSTQGSIQRHLCASKSWITEVHYIGISLNIWNLILSHNTSNYAVSMSISCMYQFYAQY